MITMFVELNRLMKQLYYANRQWFAVRSQVERLPEAKQRELFDLMVTLIEPLDELQRRLAERAHASTAARAR